MLKTEEKSPFPGGLMLRTGVAGVIALLFVAGDALAQTGIINGRVTTAEGGTPISGAQITVVGAGRGALTREDGGFSVTVQPGTYTVRVARIGYSPDSAMGVVVASDAPSNVNFQLQINTTVLSGVVVIGYGTQQ